jgi:dsRNA-specific ribonuclease
MFDHGYLAQIMKRQSEASMDTLILLSLYSIMTLRLEHLGDSVLGLCATALIREMYPCLRVGPATVSRYSV